MKLSDYDYLVKAFEEANKAFDEGTYPIGAVIVDSEGNIVCTGRNLSLLRGTVLLMPR